MGTPETTLVKSIPLSKLKASPENVRKTGGDAGLEELAASIAAHGLLQMPIVAPELDTQGQETGCYLVTAGERRRKALRLLVKRKQLPRSTMVQCLVRTDGHPSELSLAENTVRLSMHPADQFEAFARLHEGGLGLEEIAARFGVTPSVVKQRLKLAAVSPKLMARYREGELSLDQLMAFAITDDHDRQEGAFGHLSWNKSPEMIRKLLTSSHVPTSDRRARFVGAEAYEAAGGTILRDLFAEDYGGYFADRELLDRLVLEKLEASAAEVRQEGWRWVEVHPEYPYGSIRALRRVYPRSEGAYAPQDVERAGAIVSLGQSGELRVERGFIRPQDEQREPKEAAEAAAPEEPGDGGPVTDAISPEAQASASQPLSTALIENLTAQRTAALQELLAADPPLALTAVAHALALQTFYGATHDPDTCLGLQFQQAALHKAAPVIDGSRAGQALTVRHEVWARELPERSAELWDWVAAQDAATHLRLLAYCAARTLDAVHRQWEGRTRGLHHAQRLAEALALDMADWWEPTRESYLAHVPKARILAAVQEGVSQNDAEGITGLKKEAMIEQAQRLLQSSRWLPEVLRTKPGPLPQDAAAAD